MKNERNLLEETKAILEKNGKFLDNVKWIGCKNFKIFIEDFIKAADHIYNSGYGAPEVATDLLVVGEDFWLERHEYDGSEWWEFKSIPACPTETRHIRTLMNGCWDTLEELNAEDHENKME